MYLSGKIKDDEKYLPTFSDEEKEPEGSIEAEKEKNLVINKGGFYISRYEAGDDSAKANRTSDTGGTLVSKKDAYVYNYISQTDAKAKAKKFINNGNVKSGLITGIQWDMVMAFVNGKQDGKGNDYIVTESNSTRHHEDNDDVEQCGQNEADRVCNIYDLEGNCYEYVAEKNTYRTDRCYILRGGGYFGSDKASRSYDSTGDAASFYSFRFVLYVI